MIDSGITLDEEIVEFEHPMGKLVLYSKEGDEYYYIIRFIPSEIIDPAKIESIQWFFEDGDGRYTGWETSLRR